MSRIIVKNLPNGISEDKIRDQFSKKGVVTDVQLKYTTEGKFRNFCFIGYETEEEAHNAVNYFNKSCINTKRILVEICASLGDENKTKSWSKYSKDSSAYMRKNKEQIEEETPKSNEPANVKTNKVDEIIGDRKNDPMFKEFVDLHSKNKTVWGNDLEGEPDENKDQGIEEDFENTSDDHEEQQDTIKLADKAVSDQEYMNLLMNKKNIVEKKTATEKPEVKPKKYAELYKVKIKNVSKKVKRQDLIKFFKPLKACSVVVQPNFLHAIVGFKTVVDFKKALLKDRSFLCGKQVHITEMKTDNSKINNQIENNKKKWKEYEMSENVCDSGCLFFRNLPYSATESEIQEIFEKFGPTTEINIPIDKISRQIKGYGTITFVMPEHAVRAYTELNGTIFHGRMFHLIPGHTKNSDEFGDDQNGDETNFKKLKDQKLKKNASSSYNWNTLFLGVNAVADVLAKNFDTTKETILDSSAGGTSAAVRLALGETQIVLDTKKFLEENEICLDAFNTSKPKRSTTVILAKNLPANTQVSEIITLFSKYGLLGRVVLPPSGITALIEYVEPTEARLGFRNLAYTKFKHLPLYLEWAPENTFKTPLAQSSVKAVSDTAVTATPDEVKSDNNSNKKVKEETVAAANVNDEVDDEPPEENTTIFIKNLNSATREKDIEKHFKKIGKIHSVQITMKKDPENPKNKISLCYGFVQFKHYAAAEKCLKQMQFSELDGSKIELKRSDRTLKSEVQSTRKESKKSKQNGSKILVRNIPFQAKESEIRDIFKTFGELRSVRLPLKMTPGANSHRGFGFVDYYSEEDATQAFNALSQSTHLYGRRLVLEWANPDDSVETLRKRTSTHFVDDSVPKRSRKSVFVVDDANEQDSEKT